MIFRRRMTNDDAKRLRLYWTSIAADRHTINKLRGQLAETERKLALAQRSEPQPVMLPAADPIDWKDRATLADIAIGQLQERLAEKRTQLNNARADARKAEERAERADNLAIELADSRENEKRLQAQIVDMTAERDRFTALAADRINEAEEGLREAEEVLKRVHAYAESIAKSGNPAYRKARREIIARLDGRQDASQPAENTQQQSGIVVHFEPGAGPLLPPGPEPGLLPQAMLRNQMRGGGQ